MLGPQVGVYLFATDQSRDAWVRVKGQGMLLNGCTFNRATHTFTDAHGNRLLLLVASSPDRFMGMEVDKVETMDPVHSEKMFAAWEILKSHTRRRLPVVQSGQEGHDDGQELDRQRNQAPGGATLATGSAAGADDTEIEAESSDRRRRWTVGTKAGGLGEDAGRVQPEVDLLYPRVPAGQDCRQPWPDGTYYGCCLPKGHTDNHRAWGEPGRDLAEWPQ